MLYPLLSVPVGIVRARVLGRAAAPAAAVGGVSVARGGGPSEVRFGARMPHVPCMRMLLTPY